MPDPFGMAKPGDSPIIKADGRNAMRDAALAEVLRAHFVRSPGIDFGRNVSWVKAKNTSGGAVSRGKVLALTGLEIPPADNESQYWTDPLFTGGTPSSSTSRIGVCLAPIASNKVGRVAVAGAVPALVNISDSGHTFATPGSTTELVSASTTGFPILYTPGGTGTGKKCIVLLTYVPIVGTNIEVVSDVECVDGELVVSYETIKVLQVI
jgi:hypothetical protein